MINLLKLIALITVALCQVSTAYRVGAGIYDITGPSVEINFMGYALPSQRGSGIHLRLRARAFVFAEDEEDSNASKRFAFVSVDGGMGSDLVNMRVMDRLKEILGDDTYNINNVAISGTHTHSGPGGFLQYVLYQITGLGFVQETFDTWVEGITQAILMAHNKLQQGKVQLAQGKLFDSNINRSPTSYLLNPAEERALYTADGDTDKNMFLLDLISQETGSSIASVNWFAVHGTSMNNTNTLTSGDNKGYAAYLLEQQKNGRFDPATGAAIAPGMGPYVAAFASTNLGDVSPNTNGAKCIDTGEPCDGTTSTCNGRCENCIAFGPGENGDMFESTRIIGEQQFKFAAALLEGTEGSKVEVNGPIDYRHSFVKMSTLNVTLEDGSAVTLCSPAMGYSFAAGTTDGPGAFNFSQGTTSGSLVWDKVRDLLSEPTQEEIDCQAPKPILLNTGDIERPYDWDPETVPIQILRLGNVFILSTPGEFTTMAGRRLRSVIGDILKPLSDDKEIQVTIAGLTNTYSSYITTFEEYQAQRYEAASTIFGTHTLEGYIQEFSRIARDMVAGRASDAGAPPPDLQQQQIQLMQEAHSDRVYGASFGDVVAGKDVIVDKPYKSGEDIVSVTFHAANPRHNQRIQGSYLEVQQQQQSGGDTNSFVPVAYDGDWSTKFDWLAGKPDTFDFGFAKWSQATISWAVPGDAAAGTYRICYFGDHKVDYNSKVVPFSGCSSEFTVA